MPLTVKDYTIERFLSSCSAKTAKALKATCKAGDEFASEHIPTDALAAMLILATWGRRIDMEIVDDYDLLLQRTRDGMGKGVHHPDLFLASCIIHLADRGMEPTIGGFEQVGVPNIFADLYGLEEENE